MHKMFVRIARLCAATILFSVNLVSYAGAPFTNSLAPMLKTVMPAVVNIRAQIKVTDFNTMRELQKQREAKPNSSTPTPAPNPMQEGEDGMPSSYVSVGSGVIIDSNNGYIITNAHVVNDAQNIAVTLSDSRHFTGKIVGLDKASDIALLQIKAKNLTSIPVGDSTKLKVGDIVAAIGNPFGLSQTVTSGIVSALGRTNLSIESFEDFIQTDAPINPGNSGGALINMQGELVGINTAILAPDKGSIGIGFAIPSNMAKSVMQQLVQFGDVKRGALGIGAQDITPELAEAFGIGSQSGAAITQVLPGSPAEKTGFQVGDIITAVNGSPVKSASDVLNKIGFLRVNSKVSVTVIRNNKPLTVSINLMDPKESKQAVEKQNPFLYGVGLKNFTLLSPVHGNVQGVMVVGVEQDSSAWQADLRPGDVITSINQQKITNINELKKVATKADKTLLMNILRGPIAVFIVVNKA